MIKKKELEFIFFSFLYRDVEFPAVKKVKGFSFSGLMKIIIETTRLEFKNIFCGFNQKLNNKIFVYCDSINQYRALSFLKDLNDVVFVTSSSKLFLSLRNSEIVVLRDPFAFFYRFNILNYYQFYRCFKSSFKDHFLTIFKYLNISYSARRILKYHNPKAIIFSNDHNVVCRAYLHQSRIQNIKSVYLQHAAVTNRFPALDFDFSFLDGYDSLNKYSEAGTIRGQVFKVGMPKFDEYYSFINTSKKINSIGFALNIHDNVSDIFKFSDELFSLFPDLKMKLRFHPSMDIRNFNVPEYFSISDPKSESSFDFIKSIDCLIAGNSSIHLEAVLLNVYSVMIIEDGKNDLLDYYGFIKNRLVDVYYQKEFLKKLYYLIAEKPSIRYRAKYYVDTIGTAYDGKSKELVINILRKSFDDENLGN